MTAEWTRAELVRALRQAGGRLHDAAADMLEADGDREPCSIERMRNRRAAAQSAEEATT